MTFTNEEIQALNQGKPKPQGFIPKTKNDPCNNGVADRPTPKTANEFTPQPNTVLTPRETALTLSTQSHDAMKALQSSGLENAAAYIQRKQTERNAVVEKVSDAIAYLSDPDILEADIMSAAAAKVSARSNAWGYTEPVVDFDNLFALPTSSQRLLEEAS
jgi:hypothetical protein